MPVADILIIGGGLAGLTTAGALRKVGLEATILDSGERIGQSWEGRYERLHLHTVRDYSGLAHFPIPRSYPKYPSKDEYAAYLRAYAAHFDLRFAPRTKAKRVRQEVVNGRAGWGVECDAEKWSARVVVIATGQFGQPVTPDWPGLAGYAGERLHSAAYRTGRVFKGRRVLVIGAGNSALEIATDLAEQGAAGVTISIRTPPPIVPRDFLGTPAQVFGIVMHSLPPSFSDRIGGMFARLALGDLRRYGLPAPQWGPFSARRTPVIDVGFVTVLRMGKVRVRRGVRSFTSSSAIFEDGQAEPFDALIFATGFRSGLETLLEPQGLLDGHGNPLSPSGSTTACPGLYFMGFYDTLRGFMYESNLASRKLAKGIKAWMRG